MYGSTLTEERDHKTGAKDPNHQVGYGLGRRAMRNMTLYVVKDERRKKWYHCTREGGEEGKGDK